MTFALSGSLITQSGTDTGSSGISGQGAASSTPFGSGNWYTTNQYTVAVNNTVKLKACSRKFNGGKLDKGEALFVVDVHRQNIAMV